MRLNLASACVFFAFSMACGTSRPRGFFVGDEAGAPAPDGADGGVFADRDATGMPAAVAHLKGQVFAPEGTIPISGALVYLTSTMPEPIPNGVYCDRCVKIAKGVSYTYSGPGGEFDLSAYAVGSYQLVVQKGAFRRVRPFQVVAGSSVVPRELSTLPGKSDKSHGDDIPKMAVMVGAWDAIENSLAKLGLGNVNGKGQLDRSSASFDLFENAFPPNPKAKDPQKLLNDPAILSQYQIVFLPCSGSDGVTCNDNQPGAPGVQKNLQDFVAAGGKLYATDYSYEYVRQPWPAYVDWQDEQSSLGSACQATAYDAPATIEDKGLGDWLGAIGISKVVLKQNWTTVEKVSSVATTDLDGKPVNVTPKVWVTGETPSGPRPSTLSFERGCGRVLYSTYHTEGTGGAQLLPQEKALLYVLLEVSVCVGPDDVR